MGIFLGLLTALTWGGSDFLARFATRQIGALRALLYMQLFGFLLLSLFLPWLGGLGHLADGSGWQPWGWGVLAGCLNVVGTMALYRSFEIGKMAVVAPLSASYPALTLILAWLAGEKLTAVRAIGIVFTLAGSIIVAGGEKAPEDDSAEKVKAAGKGIVWAAIAAIVYGLLFWLLGIRIVPRVGAVQTVWTIRMVSVLLTIGVLLLIRQPVKLPRTNVRALAVGMGALDTSAFTLSNLGMQLEQVAVISILGSLYGAVTVGLAVIFLREHVSRWQWIGILTIFSGVLLIGR
jgi:drug/metabolite transporter (DMT)-like permease